jgi:hypothetical protein
VQPRLAQAQQQPALAHPAEHAAGARQRLAQGCGIGYRHTHVVRRAGLAAVAAVVVDQLGAAVGKLAQLEPALGHAEEGVVLLDRFSLAVGQCTSARQ